MNQQQTDAEEDASFAAGRKTRTKLKLLDGISAAAVLLLAVEFWIFSEDQLGVLALWLLIIVVLASQILKLRLKCPHCGGSVYRGWRYSYRAKVPGTCHHCGEALP